MSELLNNINNNTIAISTIDKNRIAIGLSTQEEYDEIAPRLKAYGKTIVGMLLNGVSNPVYIELWCSNWSVGYEVNRKHFEDRDYTIYLYKDIIIDWDR